MKLRIIIADDHEVVRIGARYVLEKSGAVVVGEASDPDSLMDLLKRRPCDVLVTDYNMPGAGGTGTADGAVMLGKIHRLYPRLPIVLMSVSQNVAILKMANARGVLGVISKASSMRELPLAIAAARRGAYYASKNLKAFADELGAGVGDASTPPLSPREAEVLRLLGTGLTVKQIALQQHKSISTISRQKSDAIKKLGLNGDAELFHYLTEANF